MTDIPGLTRPITHPSLFGDFLASIDQAELHVGPRADPHALVNSWFKDGAALIASVFL